MAGNEILSLLEYLEQERGIKREKLIEALERALVSAGRRSISFGKDFKVMINNTTGKIKAWVELDVVEQNPNEEQITLAEAIQIDPTAEIGGVISKVIPQKEFGRIAAQTAKQTMLQQLKIAEKARIHDDFKESLGQIISGTVRRYDANDVIVDFQKAEGCLSPKDRIPGDNLMIGDRVNVLLLDIDTIGPGPSLILSRTSKKFIRRLFEREIAEIGDGIVEIKGIARVPGARTKIAVMSNDHKVDPIGACIGIRGSRIRNITAELSGERIDIVKYDDDIYKYVKNAMQPAVPKEVEVDDANRVVNIIVGKDQIRLAIGKNWQNAKLCSQLIGMRVKILTSEEDRSFEEKIKDTVSSLAEKLGITSGTAEVLVNNGILTVEGVAAMTAEDVAGLDILEEDKKVISEKI
jgi:transcription termination/antitermination protein NusA